MHKNIFAVSALVTVLLILTTIVFADNKADNKAEVSYQTVLKIEGMHCGGCINKVKSSLMSLEGIKSCEIDMEKGQAIVTADNDKITDFQLVQAVKKAGFTAQIGELRAEGEHHSEAGCVENSGKSLKAKKCCSAKDMKGCLEKANSPKCLSDKM